MKLKPMHCPECHSKQLLTRKGDRIRWCRRCGHEWEIKPAAEIAPSEPMEKPIRHGLAKEET